MSQLSKCRGVATNVKHAPGKIQVRYHNTTVVDYDVVRGSVILNTGGWKTNTTKTRMNQAANEFGLHYRVFQEDFAWFVQWQGKVLPFDDDTIELKQTY